MTEIQSGNRYKITNVKGGTVVDLSGEDQRSIIGYTYKGGDNQHWEMERTGGGWQIKNVSNGKYLAIDGEPGDGTKLVISDSGMEWQIWPDEQDNSAHRVCVPGTKQNMDLSDHGNSNPGTPVTLWGHWKGENQVWRFEQV